MNRFKNILCVITADQVDSQYLVERAVLLAKNNQAHLTLMSVVERVDANINTSAGGTILTDLQTWMVNERQQILTDLANPHFQHCQLDTRVAVGTFFIEVIHAVLRDAYDLVIKIAEDPGWLDRLLGSDDLHLLRKCPSPVWLIKPGMPAKFRRIVAAVDVEDGYPDDEIQQRHDLNVQVMQMASSLALSEFAELHVVHAWEAIGEGPMRNGFLMTDVARVDSYVREVEKLHRKKLDALLQETIGKLGAETVNYLKTKTHLVKGSARREIPILIRKLEADMVVMGSVARTGISGLLMGNTAEMILTHIDCSVLAAKPNGFVSPVTLAD